MPDLTSLPILTDPFFYMMAVPAILIVGITKGGFAGGLGVLGVPLMALAISPLQAAAIFLPILMVMDWVAMASYWKKWDVPSVIAFIPGALIGVLIGYFTAAIVEEAHVRLIVGLVALAFTLNYWLGFSAKAATASSGDRKDRVKGGFWGTVAGFTSFVAHAGGPPFQVYALPKRLPKINYAATGVLTFTMINIIKLPPYLALGQFAMENLITAAVLLPLAPIGIRLGVYLTKTVPEGPFYKFAYAALLIVACKLLWDGLTAIL